MWLWHLGPDYMATFSLLSWAEISARFLKQILMKWNWRLHGEGFSQGCNSAQAENPSPVWKTGLGFSNSVSLRAYFLSMQVHISGWEICSQRQFRFSSIITIVGYYYPKSLKLSANKRSTTREAMCLFSWFVFLAPFWLSWDFSHTISYLAPRLIFQPGLKFAM